MRGRDYGGGDEGKEDVVGGAAEHAHHQGGHLTSASHNPLTLILSLSLSPFLIGHLTMPTRCPIHQITNERNPIHTLIRTILICKTPICVHVFSHPRVFYDKQACLKSLTQQYLHCIRAPPKLGRYWEILLGLGKSLGRRGWISQYLPRFGGARTFSSSSIIKHH